MIAAASLAEIARGSSCGSRADASCSARAFTFPSFFSTPGAARSEPLPNVDDLLSQTHGPKETQ